MISDFQMQNNDYDWFCVINDKPVCVSTNCGYIPDFVNFGNNIVNTQKRVYRLRRLHKFFLNTSYMVDNVTNKGFEYLEDDDSPYRRYLRPTEISFPEDTPEAVQYYSEYFAKIAERGFYVFDRLQGEENLYFLVAWPDSYDMENLEQHIFKRQGWLNFKIQTLDFEHPESLVDIKLIDLLSNNV